MCLIFHAQRHTDTHTPLFLPLSLSIRRTWKKAQMKVMFWLSFLLTFSNCTIHKFSFSSLIITSVLPVLPMYYLRITYVLPSSVLPTSVLPMYYLWHQSPHIKSCSTSRLASYIITFGQKHNPIWSMTSLYFQTFRDGCGV